MYHPFAEIAGFAGNRRRIQQEILKMEVSIMAGMRDRRGIKTGIAIKCTNVLFVSVILSMTPALDRRMVSLEVSRSGPMLV